MAGETTTTTVASQYQGGLSPGLNAQTFTLALGTTQLELNDVFEAGYVQGPATIIGVIVKATDMDSATGLVQKITVGSTDIVTGITLGQTGGNGAFGCTPLALTGPSKISVTNTTAATTAVAGTLYVTVLSIA